MPHTPPNPRRTSVNDPALTQIKQRTDTDMALRSPLGVVNRRVDPVTPIIVVLDEARELGLDHLHVNGADPGLFNFDQNQFRIDPSPGYDIHPVGAPIDQENLNWENDLSVLRDVLDQFDSTTASDWEAFGLRKPNLRLVVVQPEIDPNSVPMVDNYFAVGSLPSRGVTNPEAEWGSLPLPQSVLVKQDGIATHKFNDVQVRNTNPVPFVRRDHPILYRRIKVPIAMEDIRDPATNEFLYKVPAAKWTREILEQAVPGGFTATGVQNIQLRTDLPPKRKVWVATESSYGWFGLGTTVLGFVPQISTWLNLADRTDLSRTNRSPLRRMHDDLIGGDADHVVSINRGGIPSERWIRSFSVIIGRLLADVRSIPGTTLLAGAA